MTKQESQAQVEAEVKLTLKSKLTADTEILIPRYVKRTINHCLEFCNREDMTETLCDIAHDMTIAAIKLDGVIALDKDIKSISRGDTSISYKDDKGLDTFAVILSDYKSRLIRHKHMALPEFTGY